MSQDASNTAQPIRDPKQEIPGTGEVPVEKASASKPGALEENAGAIRSESADILRLPPEYAENADRVVSDFLEIKPGESVLFIADQNDKNTDMRLIGLLRSAIEKKGGRSTVFTIRPGVSQADELKGLLDTHDAFWIASDIADEILPVDFDAIVKVLKTKGKRMAHCTGVQAGSLADDGALGEHREVMEERLLAMEARLTGKAGFHITTPLGTDLWMTMKPGRPWYRASGLIRTGSWDNLPGGEIFTTPDEAKVNGVLVLTTVHNDVASERGVDVPVKLTIKDGKIVKIEGGTSADKLRQYLERNSRIAQTPESVYSCAEIAFGANANAPAVPSQTGYDGWQEQCDSTVVTEKRLGSMHVAFGDANHGGPAVSGENRAPTHLDFVLPQEGLTVRAFGDYESYGLAEAGIADGGGELLIDNGDYRLVTMPTKQPVPEAIVKPSHYEAEHLVTTGDAETDKRNAMLAAEFQLELLAELETKDSTGLGTLLEDEIDQPRVDEGEIESVAEEVGHMIESGTVDYIIVRDEKGNPVGYANTEVMPLTDEADETGKRDATLFVWLTGIRPEARGSGAVKALYAKVMEVSRAQAESRGLKIVTVFREAIRSFEATLQKNGQAYGVYIPHAESNSLVEVPYIPPPASKSGGIATEDAGDPHSKWLLGILDGSRTVEPRQLLAHLGLVYGGYSEDRAEEYRQVLHDVQQFQTDFLLRVSEGRQLQLVDAKERGVIESGQDPEKRKIVSPKEFLGWLKQYYPEFVERFQNIVERLKQEYD